VADPSHHAERIENVISARAKGDGPVSVGSKVRATRRIGPVKLRYTEEMVALDPPRTWANRGLSALRRIAIANGRVEQSDDGRRSRVTISCEFRGHGIGRLLARRLAKQLPRDEQKLKELLERGAHLRSSSTSDRRPSEGRP
jgi:hypothetical protein